MVLEYGGEAVVLEGRAVAALLPALLPLLDGTRTAEEIAATLGEPARPAVERALELLGLHGLLTDGPPLPDVVPLPFAAAALHHAGNDPAAPPPGATRQRLADATVAVVGAGAVAAEVARTLRLSGVGGVAHTGWAEAPGAAELAVVAPAPAERRALRAWNEAALRADVPWLQVLPHDGSFAAVGPLFVPGETCCHECYRRRRAANVDYPGEFWPLEEARGGLADAPAVVAAVAGLAALVTLRWLLFRDPFAAGVLLALELRETAGLTRHVVHRLPRCPACSTVGPALPLPWAEAS